MNQQISLPRFIYVGGGTLSKAAETLALLGASRPLIVTDTFLVNQGTIARLVTQLEQAGHTPAVFSDTVPDPSTDSLINGVEMLREHKADSVIGIGGGSPIDSAKALATLAITAHSMQDFKTPHLHQGPALPIVAIPTTAGSGSEATQFTVITHSETDEKMLCPGSAFLPSAAIVDFELTMSMPARLTADTGVDALTHAIEAYVSRRANAFSNVLALHAIELIGRHLVRAYQDPTDRQAREAMTLAAHHAGLAFSNSSVCLVHGMSRPIGAHFRIAHGLSNAMLLPEVTAFSVRGAESRYAACARAFDPTLVALPDSAAALALVDLVRELCRQVQVPTPEQYGIVENDWRNLVPLMAQQALASGSPANNPVMASSTQIEELYQKVFR